MKFVQARNYTKANRGLGDIEVIVIHTMEAPEGTETAENVAAWFAGPNAPMASAHYNIDNTSVVQSVYNKDVAWAAPGCNHNGIQLEHAGYARQGAKDWNDPYSRAMLDLSARLTARLCRRYQIPVRRVRAAGLKAGQTGITGHVDVSEAFRRSDHTDPGDGFPWRRYLNLVRGYLDAKK